MNGSSASENVVTLHVMSVDEAEMRLERLEWLLDQTGFGRVEPDRDDLRRVADALRAMIDRYTHMRDVVNPQYWDAMIAARYPAVRPDNPGPVETRG